jgi:hypothetical protein
MKPIGITRHILVERPAGFNAKIARDPTATSVRFATSEAPMAANRNRGLEGYEPIVANSHRKALLEGKNPDNHPATGSDRSLKRRIRSEARRREA